MYMESICYSCGQPVCVAMSPFGNLIPYDPGCGFPLVPHEKTCPKRLRPLTKEEKKEKEGGQIR